MIKAFLRQHKDDSQMIEMVTEGPRIGDRPRRLDVWCIFHSDMIQGDNELREMVDSCAEIAIEISVAP